VVVVVVVVDLCSVSRSAANALLVHLRCEQMSFQSRSEAVGTPSRVPERVWKRVPFHRTRQSGCVRLYTDLVDLVNFFTSQRIISSPRGRGSS